MTVRERFNEQKPMLHMMATLLATFMMLAILNPKIFDVTFGYRTVLMDFLLTYRIGFELVYWILLISWLANVGGRKPGY
jgi:hypothetical protein